MRLSHQFVEFIPDSIQDGILYISIPYRTVVHRCCCGCGNEVAVPISPVGWKITFDGDNISLWPSFGNWNLPCQSHYIIQDGLVRWSRKWTEDEILEGKENDARASAEYVESKVGHSINISAQQTPKKKKRTTVRSKKSQKGS